MELVSRSKRVPASTRPSASSTSIQPGLAEMKMSAGAPCWIWRASAEDPASETVTSCPVPASNRCSTSAIALAMLAAAKTVIASAAATAGASAVTAKAKAATPVERRRSGVSMAEAPDCVMVREIYRKRPEPDQALALFGAVPQHRTDRADPRRACLGHDLLQLAVMRQNGLAGLGQ